MFYAIEYAYGRNVVNNGNRADKVRKFTARRLRDAWVDDGNPYMDQSGFRENISARDGRVRGADWLEDGDAEGWKVIADRRVHEVEALARYYSIIFYDWNDRDHFRWVATAPEKEIIDWAIETQKNAESVED